MFMTNEVTGFSAQTNEVTAAPCLLLPVDCSRLGPMNNVNIVWAGLTGDKDWGKQGQSIIKTTLGHWHITGMTLDFVLQCVF